MADLECLAVKIISSMFCVYGVHCHYGSFVMHQLAGLHDEIRAFDGACSWSNPESGFAA